MGQNQSVTANELGSEQKKFFSRVGPVHLGPEGLDEETAAMFNKIIDKINSGEDSGGWPEDWLLREKQRIQTLGGKK